MHFSRIGLLTFCSTASSFVPNNPIFAPLHKHHRELNLSSDGGWDNDNFLDALGGGQSEIDDVNAKYQKGAEARSAMQERRFDSMANESQFGQGLKEEFGQVQPQAQAQAQAPFNPPLPPPVSQATVGQGQPTMDPQAYYQSLQTWQQAMTAFQQFSVSHPEAAAQMTPPPPPPPPVFTDQTPPPQVVPQEQYQAPPATTPQQPQQQPITQTSDSTSDDEPKSARDYLPKREGGNTDAYEVNNSADVYFAQLKRDSAIRKEARLRGDMEVANAPFAEKGVIALSGLLSDELVAKRREQVAQNGGEFETSRDEMILPSHFQGNDNNIDKTDSGISYKEKLMQARKKRSQE